MKRDERLIGYNKQIAEIKASKEFIKNNKIPCEKAVL
jgi:hypothetical protein